MSFKQYIVGGWVRDNLLGVESKDLDIAIIGSYDEVLKYMLSKDITIYQERPEFNTIRGIHPTRGLCDFICCKNLGHDLARRDFTINAMAIDLDTGLIIDPHKGESDLLNRTLRCVIDPNARFKEDPLRMIRAIRFIIKYNLKLDKETEKSIYKNSKFILDVHTERIRQELEKCFKLDTIKTIELIKKFKLDEYIFTRDTILWLKPTTEEK